MPGPIGRIAGGAPGCMFGGRIATLFTLPPPKRCWRIAELSVGGGLRVNGFAPAPGCSGGLDGMVGDVGDVADVPNALGPPGAGRCLLYTSPSPRD